MALELSTKPLKTVSTDVVFGCFQIVFKVFIIVNGKDFEEVGNNNCCRKWSCFGIGEISVVFHEQMAFFIHVEP